MHIYLKKIFYSLVVFSIVAAFMAGFAFGVKGNCESYASVDISEK